MSNNGDSNVVRVRREFVLRRDRSRTMVSRGDFKRVMGVLGRITVAPNSPLDVRKV